MTPNQAKQAILNRWNDEWAGATDTAYDNQHYEPQGETSWVRLSVRHTIGPQDTLGQTGNRKFRRRGFIIVQVFAPLDVGTSTADTLAHNAREVFEATSFDGIDCHNATLREIGQDKHGPWWQVNVEVSFAYDETK